MSQRLERVQREIREILAEAMSRQVIKDPRVSGAGIITITHVRVTGDLREARALFMVHGADAATLERVREGLDSAAGFLRRLLGDRLTTRVIPTLSFEVDRVFEQEEKVEALLREIRREKE
jgi:ribosome-binding factor A